MTLVYHFFLLLSGLAGDNHQPGGVGAGERNRVDKNSLHRVIGMADSCFCILLLDMLRNSDKGIPR